MQNYDKAYALAEEMRESEAYREYSESKQTAFETDMNRELYRKYRGLSRAIQAAQIAGQEPGEELTKEFQALWNMISLGDELQRFLLCEHRVSQMLSDVFKILGEAMDMDMGFLSE